MQNSKLGSLNLKDFIKGLFLTVFVSVLTLMYQVFKTTPIHIDAIVVGSNAMTAMIGYILKQLTSNSEGMPFTKEKK